MAKFVFNRRRRIISSALNSESRILNPMPDTWYADGLNFTCTRCGNCCTGEPGFVWVTDDEIAELADLRGEPPEEVVGLYTRSAHRGRTLREKANGDCVFSTSRLVARCTKAAAAVPHLAVLESTVATPAAWERRGVRLGAGRGD